MGTKKHKIDYCKWIVEMESPSIFKFMNCLGKEKTVLLSSALTL